MLLSLLFLFYLTSIELMCRCIIEPDVVAIALLEIVVDDVGAVRHLDNIVAVEP